MSRRMLRAAGLAVLLFACAAPALAQDVAPAPPRQAVAVVPEASDSKIAGRLQRILKSTGWFQDTRVAVRDGVVFLDGKTGTQEHRAWAGALAENTQGAVAVVNRIEADADVGSTFARAGEAFTSFYRQTVRIWPLVALAALIILATWLIARLLALAVRLLFASRIESPLLLSVVARAFAIPVFLLGVYFVLQFSGLTRLAITVLGGTGLIGIIIGFGLRDIAENFLASVLLSVRNPFHSGDLIDVGGHTGVVQNLNVRSTVLLTLDGNQVQIPNSTVYKSIIKNYSSIPSRRAEFTVGIGYEFLGRQGAGPDRPGVAGTSRRARGARAAGAGGGARPGDGEFAHLLLVRQRHLLALQDQLGLVAPDQERAPQGRHRTAGFRARSDLPQGRSRHADDERRGGRAPIRKRRQRSPCR